MTDFEQFDPAAWQTEGVFTRQLERAKATPTRRESSWLATLAFTIAAAACATELPTAWDVGHSMYSQTVIETGDPSCSIGSDWWDPVPDGYWQAAVERLRAAPEVEDADDIEVEPRI